MTEFDPPSMATFSALLGDPTRAAMLRHLADGSRLPAGEIALLVGVSPQVACAHLARLQDARILDVKKSGRNRLFSLRDGETAEILEILANWTDRRPRNKKVDPALCRCRMCYDHLAGELGVAIYDHFLVTRCLEFATDGPALTVQGLRWCAKHKISHSLQRGSRRPLIRICDDWTEKRPHIGGYLGAAIATAFVEAGYLVCRTGNRTIDITANGYHFFRNEMSVFLEVYAKMSGK